MPCAHAFAHSAKETNMDTLSYYTYQTIDQGLIIANVASKTAIAEVWNAGAHVLQSSMSRWLSNTYVKNVWEDKRKSERITKNDTSVLPRSNTAKDFGKRAVQRQDSKALRSRSMSGVNYKDKVVEANAIEQYPSPPNSPTQWRTKKNRSNLDRAHKHEKVTTGLLEDLQVSTLANVNYPFTVCRNVNRRIYTASREVAEYGAGQVLNRDYVKAVCINVYNDMSESMHTAITSLATGSVVESLFDIKRVDKRTHEQMVIGAGYPFVTYEVITDDGYILKLERIPRYGATKSVFLQHGVSDNAATFIMSGTVGGLAYRLYDEGYDVWLGNFRGTDDNPQHMDNLSQAEYWSFNPNHHALIDMPSMLEAIRHTQEVEKAALGDADGEKRTLTVVSHSMGAMCALMWVTHARMHNGNHFVDKLVVMSPGGYHAKIPLLCRMVGPLVNIALPRMPFLHSLKWPNEVSRILVAKAAEDVVAAKPFSRFIGLFLESLLGTPHTYEHYAFDAVHNFTFNILTGTPKGVFYFFWNNYCKQRFLGFDYGLEGNLEEYGTEEPVDFMENFDAIDVPTFFVIGLGDNLIYPENVAWQYYALKRFHPELAHLKAVDAGHIDFTYGMNEEVWQLITSVVDDKF